MKSLVVSVCITAVTDMAAVSLLVFFWCSSGFFWVLLVFFCVIEHQKNARRTPEEHQKNTRRTPEGTPEEPLEGEEHQPPLSAVCCAHCRIFVAAVSARRLILWMVGV